MLIASLHGTNMTTGSRKVYRYHPRLGFVDGSPKPSGGQTVWTGDSVLDWSSGLLVPIDLATLAVLSDTGTKYRRAIPGLRKRTLKSSPTNKYHNGGPYNGAKLRKWTKIGTKKESKRLIEVLPDVYTVPGIKGRYEYDATEDRYEWQD